MTHEAKANQTELSKYAWSLKRREITFEISWEILERTSSYTNLSGRCDLLYWRCYFSKK